MKSFFESRRKGILRLLLSLVLTASMLAAVPVVSRAADFTSWDQLQAAIDSEGDQTYILTQDIVASDSVSKPLTFPSGADTELYDLPRQIENPNGESGKHRPGQPLLPSRSYRTP